MRPQHSGEAPREPHGQVLRENPGLGPWSTRAESDAPDLPPSPVLPAGGVQAGTAAFSAQHEHLTDRDVLGPFAAFTALRRNHSPSSTAAESGPAALTRLLAAHLERSARHEALLAEASPWIPPGMVEPPQQPLYGAEEPGSFLENAAPSLQPATLPWIPSWLSPRGVTPGESRRAAQAPVPSASEHGRKAPTLTSHGLHRLASEPLPVQARPGNAPAAAEAQAPGSGTPAPVPAAPRPSPVRSLLVEQIAEITPERFRELLARVLEEDALRHGLNLKEG